MSEKIRYEFDAERQVLIKCPSQESPKIIEKSNLVWRDFGPQDEPYARAIFLGQGCWERLDTISEEEVQQILMRWGYLSSNSKSDSKMILPVEPLADHDLINNTSYFDMIEYFCNGHNDTAVDVICYDYSGKKIGKKEFSWVSGCGEVTSEGIWQKADEFACQLEQNGGRLRYRKSF